MLSVRSCRGIPNKQYRATGPLPALCLMAAFGNCKFCGYIFALDRLGLSFLIVNIPNNRSSSSDCCRNS